LGSLIKKLMKETHTLATPLPPPPQLYSIFLPLVLKWVLWAGLPELDEIAHLSFLIVLIFSCVFLYLLAPRCVPCPTVSYAVVGLHPLHIIIFIFVKVLSKCNEISRKRAKYIMRTSLSLLLKIFVFISAKTIIIIIIVMIVFIL
jgi:hypothetical protein